MACHQSQAFSQKVKEGMLRAKARGRFSGGFVDLAGRSFGQLSVVKQAENGRCGRVRWLCECKCGKQTKVFGDGLSSGRTKSCGCGMGVRLYGRVPPYKYIWFNYRGSAKRRGLPFELSLDTLVSIISRPCDYCGKPPSRAMSPSQMRKHISYQKFRYNGIDRIDSSKGYVESNVVPCCKPCNELKSDKPREEFLAQVAAIHCWQHR